MPLIRLARYVDGSAALTFEECDILTTEYFAISHVWGAVSWRRIPACPHKVLLSSHKARFVNKTLPSHVGDSYFWMDVLCVDQQDVAAKKGIVAHIPAIFSHAQRTMALRDGDGLRQCCLDFTENTIDWSDWKHRLIHHCRETHNYGFRESYLDRLWTLQELLLSNNVQFMVCPQQRKKDQPTRSDDYHQFAIDSMHITDSLHSLGYTWLRYGNDEDLDLDQYQFQFVNAFAKGGFISRSPRAKSFDALSLPNNMFSEFFSNSTRTATVPADYVLAIFPQLAWYRVPDGVKTMTFSELFQDCCRQADQNGHSFLPLITASMIGDVDKDCSWQPASNIPEPQCLGDFLKLLGTARNLRLMTQGAFTSLVKISSASSDLDLLASLDLIKSCINFSKSAWSEAYVGELSIYGSWPEGRRSTPDLSRIEVKDMNTDIQTLIRKCYQDECIERLDGTWITQQSMMILAHLAAAYLTRGTISKSWEAYERWLVPANPHGHKDSMLFIAAMVNCRLPLSALDWAKSKFRPVIIHFRSVKVLGLVSAAFASVFGPRASFTQIRKDIPVWKGMQLFWRFACGVGFAMCAERPRARRWPAGQNLVLVDLKNRAPVGLVPDFLYHAAEDEMYVDRLLELFTYAEPQSYNTVRLPLVDVEDVQIDSGGRLNSGQFQDPGTRSTLQQRGHSLEYRGYG